MRAVSGWIVGNYMQCTPGSSARTQGTAVPQESEAQTEQHMLGHRFPAWNKSTGLSFISNVCDLHQRGSITQPQQSVVYRGMIDRNSYFVCPASLLPFQTTWYDNDNCGVIAQNIKKKTTHASQQLKTGEIITALTFWATEIFLRLLTLHKDWGRAWLLEKYHQWGCNKFLPMGAIWCVGSFSIL